MGLGHQGLAFKKKPTLLSLQVKQPVGRAVGAQRQLGRLGTEVEAWGGQRWRHGGDRALTAAPPKDRSPGWSPDPTYR